MKLDYKPFAGMRPAVDPRFLDKSEAIDAIDCDLRYLSVKPFRAPDVATLASETRIPLGYDVTDPTPAPAHISHLHDTLHNEGGSIPKGLYEIAERGTYVAPSVVVTDEHERVYFTRPGGGMYDRGRTDGVGPFEERPVGVPAPVDPDEITSVFITGRDVGELNFTFKWRYYMEVTADKTIDSSGPIADSDVIVASDVDPETNETVLTYTYDVPRTAPQHPAYNTTGFTFIMYGEMTSDKGRFLGTVYPEPSGRVDDTDAYVGGTIAKGEMENNGEDIATNQYRDLCQIQYAPASEEYSYYRSYVFTYVTDRGEESAPSAPSDPVAVLPTQYVTLTIATANAPANVTHMRVYRTETTEGGTAFFFVEEVPIANPIVYEDFTLSVDLDGDTLQTLNWAPPPDDLKGLTLSTKNFYAGYVGSQLFLSELYIPYAWPTDYAIDFTGNILHIARYGDTICVFTDREIALIVGNTPLELRKIKVEGFELLTSIFSTTEMDGLLYFSTPIGLAAVSGTNVAVVSDDLIAERWWRDNINVTETRIVSFDNTIYVLADEDGQIYRMGLQSDGGGFVRLSDQNVRDLYTSSSYLGVVFLLSDPEGDAYVFDTGEEGDRLVKWRGRTEVADIPMAVISVRILATEYPIQFRAYNEVDAQLDIQINSDKVRKLPVMKRGREWSFEVEALTNPANIVSLEVGTSGRAR